MHTRVAIVYNEPHYSRYNELGEEKAVLGVLEAVEAVNQALVQLNYDVICMPLVPPLERAKRRLKSIRADLVFNLFEGFCGYPETEAIVPELLSESGMLYTGCTGPILKLALDKANMKVLFRASGIPTPDYQLLNPHILYMFRLGYPCIVKPRREDASHGMSAESVVNDYTALKRQVELISNSYGGSALVEEFIDGREFNATVLGNSELTVLPVSEIIYSLPDGMPKVLTFAAKWDADSLYFKGTKVVCPADPGAEEQKQITETARAAFKIFGIKGYARVDMRMDHEGQLNVIEVNPNPDISPGSGAVLQAEAAGMTYTQFIEKIAELVFNNSNENQYSINDLRRQTRHSKNTMQYSRIQTF